MLSLLTLQISTPGMFLTALANGAFSLLYTKRGPFLILYLLFLNFPFPALKVLLSTTFLISSKAPTAFKNLTASLVLS